MQEPPRPFDLEVLLGDPFVTADKTTAPGRPAGLAEPFTVGDLVPPYARRARCARPDRDTPAVEPRTGPNMVLIPHLARLGSAAVDEVLRVAAGLLVAHPMECDALFVSA